MQDVAQTDSDGTGLHYDPYSQEIGYNPHPLFRRMRDEAPLYHNDEHGFYALSRFDDIERAHIDWETYSSAKGVTLDLLKASLSGEFEIPPGTIIFEDPPTHTMHRALLSRMFTPRRISGLESQIRTLCQELIDPAVESGRFDFVTDFGNVMPTMVIGMLVGIPEEDRMKVRDHYDAGRKLERDERDHSAALDGEIFADYIDWRVENPSDDIMTQLMTAEFEDETGSTRRLTREELLAYVNIVAAAGNDTTRRFIGWAGKLLSDHPDQRQLLVDDPLLIPNAVDEILRFEPPPLQSCRYVTRDLELYGQAVPAGSIMALLLCSANRDERRIEDPDRFDVTRQTSSMFTFGFGPHYCLGQALARLQARVALEEVLARLPDWETDWDNAAFFYDGDLRGWNSFPVVTP